MAAAATISRVVLVKTASVTHSWNMEQRFIELTFQQTGSSLRVQAPTRAADAPPGFYLLFAFNAAGTPSVAKIVRVGVAAEPESRDDAEPRQSRRRSPARPARPSSCSSPPPTRTAKR